MLAAAAAQIAEPLATPFSALTGPLLVYLQAVAGTTAHTPLSVVQVDASPAAIAAICVTVAVVGGAVHPARAPDQRQGLRAATPTHRRARGLAVALAAATAGLFAIAGGVAGESTLPGADGG